MIAHPSRRLKPRKREHRSAHERRAVEKMPGRLPLPSSLLSFLRRITLPAPKVLGGVLAGIGTAGALLSSPNAPFLTTTAINPSLRGWTGGGFAFSRVAAKRVTLPLDPSMAAATGEVAGGGAETPPSSRAPMSAGDVRFLEDRCGFGVGGVPPNALAVSARRRRSRGGGGGDDGGNHGEDTPVAIKCYPLGGGSPRKRRRSRSRAATEAAAAARAAVDDDAEGRRGRDGLSPSSAGAIVADDDRPRRHRPFPTLYWLCCPEVSRAVSDLERRGYVGILEDRLRSDPELHSGRMRLSHRAYAEDRWDTLSSEDREWLLSGGGSGPSPSPSSSSRRFLAMLRDSGVAGAANSSTDLMVGEGYGTRDDSDPSSLSPSSPWSSIKCLHAHYAFYRSVEHDEGSIFPLRPRRFGRGDGGEDYGAEDGGGGAICIVGRWVHELLVEIYPECL